MNLFTDGGARGNPGPGALGVVIKDSKGKKVFELGKYLGECTNNEAEYEALIAGLEAAKERNYSDLTCFLDSELVVKQLTGEYKVKNTRLKVYFDKVKKLSQNFKNITFKHVPRTKNAEADALVNKVLDSA